MKTWICFLSMISLLTAATTPERATIEERDKWDLSKMYPSLADWEADCKQLDGLLTSFPP